MNEYDFLHMYVEVYMKKILVLTMFALITLSAGFSQELITLDGSNQNLTTAGFEMNEYDYLINPLYFSRLSNPWMFFGMDGSVTQLANNIISNGVSAGWAPGGPMTPVFLGNYKTNSDLSVADEGDNVEIDYTTYDQATGTYAEVTETVTKNIRNSEIIHDLVLHGGLSISDTLALAMQFAMAMDTWRVEYLDYTNNYSNTAAPAPSTLSSKDRRTERTVHMRDSSENSYKVDLEAGLDLGNFVSRIVLGLGWYYPGSANNVYRETQTDYDLAGGIDDTIIDEQNIAEYSGQYYYSGSAFTSFSMTGSGVTAAEFFRVALQTDNTLPLGEDFNLIIPFNVQYDFYSPNLNTVFTDTGIVYNDAVAGGQEESRDVTTTTTNLSRTLDLAASTGGHVAKSVSPTENTSLHFGGGLDFEFLGTSDTRTQQKVRHYQEDNNGDGDYADAGTDVDTTYTESGYEVQRRELDYNFDLTGRVGLSYSPVPVLNFHAGFTTTAEIDMAAVNTLTTGNAGFIYEQYTDNLESANSYARRQKDGTSTESTPASSFGTDFDFTTNAEFGFTLDFSDNFRLDARATAGDLGFDEFSAVLIYSK